MNILIFISLLGSALSNQVPSYIPRPSAAVKRPISPAAPSFIPQPSPVVPKPSAAVVHRPSATNVPRPVLEGPLPSATFIPRPVTLIPRQAPEAPRPSATNAPRAQPSYLSRPTFAKVGQTINPTFTPSPSPVAGPMANPMHRYYLKAQPWIAGLMVVIAAGLLFMGFIYTNGPPKIKKLVRPHSVPRPTLHLPTENLRFRNVNNYGDNSPV